MAYVIDTGDILEHIVVYRLDGQILMNVLHYQVNLDAVPIADGAAALDGFNADQVLLAGSFYNEIQEAVSNEVTFLYLQTQVIHPIRRLYTRTAVNSPGSRAGAALPTGVAGCVTKRTQATGRGRTGRVEIGGMLATDNANGLVDAAGVAKLVDVGASMLVQRDLDGQAAILDPVVFRRLLPGTSEDIVAVTVQPELRYLTRRTVGRGI